MNAPELETAVFARCPVCDEMTFPVHELSPCGHDAEPRLVPLTEAGRVFSWTRTHQQDAVTVLAMADFFDGALRITAPIRGVTEIAIGDLVRARSGDDGSFLLEPAH